MEVIRKAFDGFYDLVKPLVFQLTKRDPQIAHELFAGFCRGSHKAGIDDFLFSFQKKKLPFEISNAAGFNKNGEIPPMSLAFLGFDRVVIGTVLYESHPGNPRPTTRRFPETESVVNWMGLPCKGAKYIADRINRYGLQGVDLTINLMSTPRKQGDKSLRDIEGTIITMRDLSGVDRFELNISCPNTHSQKGKIDARKEYQSQLEGMLSVLDSHVYQQQEVYLKVSPNSSEEDVEDIVRVGKLHRVHGITATNTSSQHDPKYIPKSPGKGGSSGNALYEGSKKMQQLFYEKVQEAGLNWNFIACGGINSAERAEERIKIGAKEIQIFTPFIFSGPKLLRELHQGNYKNI